MRTLALVRLCACRGCAACDDDDCRTPTAEASAERCSGCQHAHGQRVRQAHGLRVQQAQRAARAQGARARTEHDSPEWRALRAAALKRDGHQCPSCGATAGLRVHHVVPVRAGGESKLDNLSTRCPACRLSARAS